MKGIVVLSYDKTPGSYIDCEYPVGITLSNGIGSIECNKIYSFNRMHGSNPNYIFLKANGNQICSFFSGLENNNYIGSPDHCIFLILDDENPKIWSEKLEQISLEILPFFFESILEDVIDNVNESCISNIDFTNLLKDKFDSLQENIEEFSTKDTIDISNDLKDDMLNEGVIQQYSIMEKEDILSVIHNDSDENNENSSNRKKNPSEDSINNNLTEKLEELEEEIKLLHEENDLLHDTINDISQKLEDCKKNQSEYSIDDIKSLGVQLESAKKKAEDYLMELSNKKEMYENNEKLVKELTHQLMVKGEPLVIVNDHTNQDAVKDELVKKLHQFETKLKEKKEEAIQIKKQHLVILKENTYLRKLLELD